VVDIRPWSIKMSATETILAPFFPPAFFAKKYKTHVNTIIRWFRDGVLFRDGVRYRPEHTRLPGSYLATEEAISEFLELVKADRMPRNDAPAPVAPIKRQAARAARAQSALAAEGF
jgi:hypothetical protein